MTGIVKNYNGKKGYGFVTGEDGKKLFFHRTEIKNVKKLKRGHKVTYDVSEYNGRPVATNLNKIQPTE